MVSYGTVISYPVPAYANVAINPQYYKPQQFFISAITRGSTTTVTTTVDHDYVVGQQVRMLIPRLYGCQQINGQRGFVLSIPSSTQVEIEIDSSKYDAYVVNPITATITNATKASNCVITCANSFRTGNYVKITDVGGMTQLNGNVYQAIRVNSTTLVLNVDSSGFSNYTSGGTATLQTTDQNLPQIVAVGDINGGQNNPNVINSNLNIPGAFINISPL